MTRAADSSGRAAARSEGSFPLRAGPSTAPGLLGSLASQRRAFESLRSAGRIAVPPPGAAPPSGGTASEDGAPTSGGTAGCGAGETPIARSTLSPTVPAGVAADPVFFGHRYADPGDQEIASTVAAVFAYGRIAVMARSIDAILASLGPHPQAAILTGTHRRRGWGRDLRYRFQRSCDVVGLLQALCSSVDRWGGLGLALMHHVEKEAGQARDKGGCSPVIPPSPSRPSAESGLAAWVATLRRAAGCDTPGLRHLLADPATGGVVKRWRLLMRWMVRPADGVDLGLWSDFFSPAALILPLDTHWIRIGTRLGWTARRTADARMAIEITAGLRRLAPADPLRYDLPVCHLGISGACPPRLDAHHCAACPLQPVCRTGAAKPAISRPA